MQTFFQNPSPLTLHCLIMFNKGNKMRRTNRRRLHDHFHTFFVGRINFIRIGNEPQPSSLLSQPLKILPYHLAFSPSSTREKKVFSEYTSGHVQSARPGFFLGSNVDTILISNHLIPSTISYFRRGPMYEKSPAFI